MSVLFGALPRGDEFWKLTLHLSNRSLLPWFSESNSIGDDGASALGAGLKGSALQALDLGECVVLGRRGDEFWELTLHLSNRSLLPQFSGSNKISDAGASALAAGLKDSKVDYLVLGECFVRSAAMYVSDVAPLSLLSRQQLHFGRREGCREVRVVGRGQIPSS